MYTKFFEKAGWKITVTDIVFENGISRMGVMVHDTGIEEPILFKITLIESKDDKNHRVLPLMCRAKAAMPSWSLILPNMMTIMRELGLFSDLMEVSGKEEDIELPDEISDFLKGLL